MTNTFKRNVYKLYHHYIQNSIHNSHFSYEHVKERNKMMQCLANYHYMPYLHTSTLFYLRANRLKL